MSFDRPGRDRSRRRDPYCRSRRGGAGPREPEPYRSSHGFGSTPTQARGGADRGVQVVPSLAAEHNAPPSMRFGEILVFTGFLLGAVVFTYPMARDLRTAVTDPMDPLLDAWAIGWIGHQIVEDPVAPVRLQPLLPGAGYARLYGPDSRDRGSSRARHVVVPRCAAHPEHRDPPRDRDLGLRRLPARRRPDGLARRRPRGRERLRLLRLPPDPPRSRTAAERGIHPPSLHLCLRRYLDEGHVRHAVGVAVFLWLVCASSAYYGLYSWVMLAIAVPYEMWRTRTYFGKKLFVLGGAFAASALAFLPIALPIMNMGSNVGLERPLPRLQRASARPADYLRSGSHLHGAIGLPPPSPERTLFPGLTAVGLSLVALAAARATPRALRPARARRVLGEPGTALRPVSRALRARARHQRGEGAAAPVHLRVLRARDAGLLRGRHAVSPRTGPSSRAPPRSVAAGRDLRRAHPLRPGAGVPGRVSLARDRRGARPRSSSCRSRRRSASATTPSISTGRRRTTSRSRTDTPRPFRPSIRRSGSG